MNDEFLESLYCAILFVYAVDEYRRNVYIRLPYKSAAHIYKRGTSNGDIKLPSKCNLSYAIYSVTNQIVLNNYSYKLLTESNTRSLQTFIETLMVDVDDSETNRKRLKKILKNFKKSTGF